jgi:hypothetical protein
MASITSWTRLEPRSRSVGVEYGLQARIYDPLWFLARQWQMGEFLAEDAGMPVTATLRADAGRPTRCHAGPIGADDVEGRPYNARTPLEAVVERERLTARGAPFHPARAVEAGLHFLRLLGAHNVGQYRDAYRAVYALRVPAHAGLDADGARYLRVMNGRAVDGHRLYGDFVQTIRPDNGTEGLPDTPEVDTGDQPAIIEAAKAWLAWYEHRFSEPEDEGAWMADRMEYAFAISVPMKDDEIVLAADEYFGGRLDWYHLNRRTDARLGAAGDEEPLPFVRTVIPGPVSFRGMPDTRWWAFEDAEVDLGSMEAGTEDLGRMLLQQFAFNYSNDWFTLPVEMEFGSLLEIRSLVVTDTFGVRTLVRPYGEVDGAAGDWQMFVHSASSAAERNSTDGSPAGNLLFLPPVLGASLHGRPLEEVHFLRDETANMAWAVERTIENVRGQALDRHEHYLATRPDPSELIHKAPEEANLIYTLATEVPEHWIPLLPVLNVETEAMELRRGKMLQYRGEEFHEIVPKGRILEPESDLRLREEEVQRAGAFVDRAFQLARWVDGSSHLWMARRKRPGRGEGWSGLRYDFLEHTEAGSQ